MSRLEFNVAGPCVPGEHYMLDPLRGIESELMSLIDGKHYFVMHAARQTGKTTLLKELTRRINAKGEYYALYCSLEVLDGIAEPEKGFETIISRMRSALENCGMPEGFAADANVSDYANVLRSSLFKYCRALDKPLVIFFDEADCVSNGTLITFLRQLRDGYIDRGDVPFVRSIALVGMRNIRDYKARVRPETSSLGGASPFNIITKTFNLRNFTQAEVIELYAQHTAATGQAFEPPVIDYVFEQTQGQPWLVNAIARECIVEILKNDSTIPITQPHAEQAIQNIVRDRRTHIDSLLDKLKDPRVRSVVIPLITGNDIVDFSSDDYMLTKDLGLIRDDRRKVEPANPIYGELIIKTLNWSVQESLRHSHSECTIPRYLKNDKLDMDFLIREFQTLWRENSGIWKARYKKDFYEYDEAAAQLVMQAFLQCVVNGRGHVARELAANTGRADLCVIYDNQKYPVELKILQNERSRERTFEQMSKYMDTFGADTGWLVVFDNDAEKSWDDKVYMKEEIVNGKKIVVAGC